MEKHKYIRETKQFCTGGFGPQVATKDTNGILKILNYFPEHNFGRDGLTKTSCYLEQLIKMWQYSNENFIVDFEINDSGRN